MKDLFATYHPITVFSYFIFAIFITAFVRNPLVLLLGVALSMALYVNARGLQGVINAAWFILISIIITFIYAFIETRGEHVIFMYGGGRTFTFEALMGGIAICSDFLILIFLASVFFKYLSIEKFLFLFGGFMPTTTLALSSIFRFIPKYQERAKYLHETRACMGLGASNGSVARRTKGIFSLTSDMHKWVIDSQSRSIKSMKSRGFGQTRRTTFTRYEFRPRDLAVMVLLVICVLVYFTSIYTMGAPTQYFPFVDYQIESRQGILAAIAYGVLLVVPLAINLKGWLSWRIYVSRI